MTTRSKKKPTKRKPKPTKLDFNAPEGKEKVHVFIAVNELGIADTATYEKRERGATLEDAIACLSENGEVVYHTVLVLAKPKKPKATKVKAKAKRVTPKKKAPATAAPPVEEAPAPEVIA